MKFYRTLRDLLQFMQLPTDKRRLTFYSESENYWPHLEGLVRGVLSISNIDVCYISSGNNDPGLYFKHPNYKSFEIDEGFVRDWLFENIKTDVMVMTMPDLHQYQVKKSKYKVHYVYVQHSLVSLHTTLRKGALDYYDTIFCAGPHHIKEIRAIEAKYHLPEKKIVAHGYGRLDAIIYESKKRLSKIKVTGNPTHILIAPSWGQNGTIESGVGEKVIGQLLAQGNQITFRPHPQTVKFSKRKVNAILKKFGNFSLFSYDANVAGQESLHDSDIMISDWSSAALDYAFGLNKPVLFIDVPQKINNDAYEALNLNPIEVEIRSLIGDILELDNIDQCGEYVNRLISKKINIKISDYVYNIGSSATEGCSALKKIITNNNYTDF